MSTDAVTAVAPVSAPDDYTYDMTVQASLPQILQAVTDDTTICRWWTAAHTSERDGDVVRLLRDGAPFITFTVGHGPGLGDVSWAVSTCVMDEWPGTTPSFSVRPNDDGTCSLQFRHIGLRPALECFEQCRAGWGHFMPSLHQFLETGEGLPDSPRTTTVR